MLTATAPIILPQIPQNLDDDLKRYLAALQLALSRYFGESASSTTRETGTAGSMNFLGFNTNSGVVSSIEDTFVDITTVVATTTQANLVAWGGVSTNIGSAGTLRAQCKIIVGSTAMSSGSVQSIFDSSAPTDATHSMTAGGVLTGQTEGSKTFKLQVRSDPAGDELAVDATDGWLMVAEYTV